MIEDLKYIAELLTKARHDANLLMQSLASEGEEAVPSSLYMIIGRVDEAIKLLEGYQPVSGADNAKEDR